MNNNPNELYLVGVGASAGGLEALQQFVKNLPDDINIAYVVAQHLSPTYKSLMASLLSKETEHRVIEAKNGTRVLAGHMYICPPNKNISVHNDIIYLKEPITGSYGPKPSIDILFESLASSKGSHCAGIILSGTGSDGSRGIRAIKAEGGFTIAQEPGSAKYDGMPLAAINTGNIDLILKPEEIGGELPEIFSGADRTISNEANPESFDVLKNIFHKLFTATKIDFSDYKINTIQRRIERRMSALKIGNMTDYNNVLQKDRDEVFALYKDILIGVTSFFRDQEAFDRLKDYLQEYLAKKEEKSLRVWIPGCSSGEEPYTIAILIMELLGSESSHYKIQIFATDIDEEATQQARKGLFPESALINLDKNLRNKYFTPRKDQYEIIKPVREMVIFSVHNINSDPPFLKLDLISCRNLLIYFTSKLQRRIFPMFHYALNDNGLLLLGKSETVGQYSSHFKTLDKNLKIFSAIYTGPKSMAATEITYNIVRNHRRIKETKNEDKQLRPPAIPELMTEQIEKHILPTCVTINDEMNIIYIKGNNPYISFSEGLRNDNIYRNIHPTLSTELRAAMHDLKKDPRPVLKTNFIKVKLYEDITRQVRLIIMSLQPDNKVPNLYMICFQEEKEDLFIGSPETVENGETLPRVTYLEDELARTKEHLQTVIEELETTNEETQSLNEELQSSNEELQSSNEELETTNEELQSTNEELQTAYSELKATFDEKEEKVKAYTEIQRMIESSEKRLKVALELSQMGVFDYTIPITNDCYWDDNFGLIFGYESGELPRDKKTMHDWLRERIIQDDRESFDKAYRDFINSNKRKLDIRVRFNHKNGSLGWVKLLAHSAGRNPDNQVNHVVGVAQDITKLVELETPAD